MSQPLCYRPPRIPIRPDVSAARKSRRLAPVGSLTSFSRTASAGPNSGSCTSGRLAASRSNRAAATHARIGSGSPVAEPSRFPVVSSLAILSRNLRKVYTFCIDCQSPIGIYWRYKPNGDAAMSDWKILDRNGRAVLLAATTKITQNTDGWRVPSQSGKATYTVKINGEKPHCTCPVHELRACECKHILAVRIVRQRELFDDGSERVTKSLTLTKTVCKSYPQNWKAYNAAQTTEKEKFQELLRELCEGIEEKTQKRGRPRI